LGATVVLRPPDEIVAYANHLAAARGLTLVPPFDDARVIAGQGTVGLELLGQVDDLDVVVVPVGGGGLLAGVAAAVKSRRPGARVIAVEPKLAGDLAEGYATGRRTVWSRELTGRTIADGLRSGAVGQLAWAHIKALVDDAVTVTEESIVSAMRWTAECHAFPLVYVLERLDAVRSVLLDCIQVVDGLAHVVTDGPLKSFIVAKSEHVQDLLVLLHQNIHSRVGNPEVVNTHSGFGCQGVVNPHQT